MAEKQQMGETPDEPTTETEVTLPASQPEGETPEAQPVDLDALQRSLKNKEQEAARLHKKLEAFEKAEQARKDAELSEKERLEKQLKEAQAENESLRRGLLQRQIAAKYGLPEELADRLQGETPDDLEADAKKLSELMPKPKPQISTTNPPAGQPRKATPEEWAAFLHGGGPLPTRS